MSEKYIDLKSEIIRRLDSFDTKVGIVATLNWLDEHPDQVPGRTITEGEYSATVSEVLPRIGGRPVADQVRELLAQFGLTIVDDPEPTNAEKLEGLFAELMKRQMTYKAAGEWLDKHGVRAPGGDDEH